MYRKYCFFILNVFLSVRYGFGKDCDCKMMDVLKNMFQKDIFEREILATRVDMLESRNGGNSAGNTTGTVTVLDEKLTEMKNLIETTKTVQKETVAEQQNAERLNFALANAWKNHKQDFSTMKKDILELINNNNKSFHDLTIEVEKHMEVMEVKVDLLINQTSAVVTKQLKAAEERFKVIESGINKTFESYKSQMNNDFQVFMNKADNVRSSDLQRIMSTLDSLTKKLDKDDCVTNPCLNGGTFVDGINKYSCVCNAGYFGKKCDHAYSNLSDCFELRKEGRLSSGIYGVTLWKTKTKLQVVCDMDTDNGGWTVFQNRFDGSVDFYQNFTSYEHGFGELNGEFWLGLKYIQEMASVSQTEMRFDVTAADGSTAYEVHRNFSLTSGPDYRLHIGMSTGTLGVSSKDSAHPDYVPSLFSFTPVNKIHVTPNKVERFNRLKRRRLALTPIHENTTTQGENLDSAAQALLDLGSDLPRHLDQGDSNPQGLLFNNEKDFSTFDHDRDTVFVNCAVKRRGGWWYYSCAFVNLNGDYAKPGTESAIDDGSAGMIYYPFKGKQSLKSSKMMFRRVV